MVDEEIIEDVIRGEECVRVNDVFYRLKRSFTP